jgi:predicted enzyme related to lactoylglutathione lyase
MDAFKTHGAFSWNELMTSDPDAALGFYKTLFGWKTEAMAMAKGGTYHVLKVDGAPVGGVMALPKDAPAMPPCWGGYVTVNDADATVRQCTQLGGRLIHGPEDIPGVGRFAVLADPQGAVINVIAYRMEQG